MSLSGPEIDQPATGYQPRRKPRWGLIALIALGHFLVGVLLARFLAPDFTASIIDRAASTVMVTVDTREEPEPQPTPEKEPDPEPDEGAAAPEGREAEPRAVTLPDTPLPTRTPVPRASSTGTQASQGSGDRGAGAGAGGEGEGRGSGRAGSGRGGIPVTGPSVRSGSIDSARDFPVPVGGRRVREGTSVTVAFTVGVDGRASRCSVTQPGPDPQTNALVCPLVIERIRFNPARDANGEPVPARYGWRQDFFRR